MLLLLAIWFRGGHIERKVFWDDETYTALRVVGLTEGEMVRRAPAFATMADVTALLHPSRADRRPLSATIASLLREDPQHPPLYYACAYFWTWLFGTSIAAIRSLSVVFGLATLPLMYWLCAELFESRIAAWTGTALLGVSPIFVIFSQEAREYSLWVATTVWMCAALLRAMRRNSFGAWAIYASAFVAGLYAYPLTVLVAFGHALYVLLATRRRGGGTRRAAFVAACIVATLTFVPWLAAMLQRTRQIGVGLTPSARTGLQFLFNGRAAFHALVRSLGQVRLSAFDVDPTRTGPLQGTASAVVIAAIVYSSYRIARASERRFTFVATLMLATSIPVFLANVTLPDQPFVPRFYLPFYLATVLCLSGGLFLGVREAVTRQERRAAQGAACVVFASCILSCSYSAPAETWWNKANDESKTLARIIAKSAHSLIASDARLDYSLVLSYYVPPATALVLRPRCWLCDAPPEPVPPAALATAARGSTVYLLGPSAALQREAANDAVGPLAARCFNVNVRAQCASAYSIYPDGW